MTVTVRPLPCIYCLSVMQFNAGTGQVRRADTIFHDNVFHSMLVDHFLHHRPHCVVHWTQVWIVRWSATARVRAE